MCRNESGNGATVSYINVPVSLSTGRPTAAVPRSLSPWNYTGNTQHALVINSNCFHVFFILAICLEQYLYLLLQSENGSNAKTFMSRWNRKTRFFTADKFSGTCTWSEMKERAKSYDKCCALRAKMVRSLSPSLSFFSSEGQTDISTGAKFSLGTSRVMTALSFSASSLDQTIAVIFKLNRCPFSAYLPKVMRILDMFVKVGLSCTQQSSGMLI